MNTRLFFIFLLLGLSKQIYANDLDLTNGPIKPAKELQQKLMLVIQDKGGNNGVAVAYHPKKKLYYAGYAGNADYPLEVFDSKGKPLHSESIKFDARGLWYNSSCDCLEGNSYNFDGLYSFSVNKEGIPQNRTKRFFDQPNAQAAGCYDPKTKKVISVNLEDMNFYFYDYDRGIREKVVPIQGITEQEAEYINPRIAHTGVKGEELALANYSSKRIYLFNQKTGELAKTLKLPNEAPLKSFFNFDVSNGYYWVYDIDRKIWFGYK